MLNRAVVVYGEHTYQVKPNELTPLPVEFDFERPEECARLIFAIMSNASGGHKLTRCELRIDTERRTANLTANGAHVFYKPADLPPMCVAEAIAAMERIRLYRLGTVMTDQYGKGYERAVWTD